MKNFKRKESLKEAGIITVDEHCVLHSKQNIQQAGITLVALVVTIIVLLILAGVTITLALSNNGVIGRAQHASNTWANATKDEEAMMGELGQQIDDYAGIKTEGNDIKVSDLEIGDYIKYGNKLEVKTYDTDASYTGVSQTFETNNQMLWRVMNKKNNGEVEIVAVSNMLDNGETDMNYYIGEERIQYLGLMIEDFLNAETLLNDICDYLYSSNIGIGRSINVDDINRLNGFNPETSSWTDLDSESFGDSKTYGVLQEYVSGPVWDEENNEINTASNDNHLYARHTHYSYYVSTSMPLYDTLASGIQNEVQTTYYWLASRCWNANDSGNQWAHGYNMLVRFIGMGKNQTARASVRDWSNYSTNMGGYVLSGAWMCGIRPVVTLDSNATIQNDSTKDGKTEEKAYLLE